MALVKFKAPTLPAPLPEYNRNYLNQLVGTLSRYFNLLDSTTPIQVDYIILNSSPTSGYGLPLGSVYRNDDVLYVVVDYKAYSYSFSATPALGSVTVTT